MSTALLELLPVWLVGLLFFVLLVCALEIGFRAGYRRREIWKDAEEGGGNLVLTSILALLGLILAFTFADGVSHYKTRKQAVLAETNALGTAFLRTDMVADPGRTKLKQALLDYARTRAIDVGKIHSAADALDKVEQSSQALSRLWPVILEILEQEPPGPVEVSLVSAVNEVIDSFTLRNTATFDTLPGVILVLLIFITSAAMAVAGFNAGLSGRMSRFRMGIFALVLAGVVLVIQDFDRPITGFIHVSHASIESVIAEMEAQLAE